MTRDKDYLKYFYLMIILDAMENVKMLRCFENDESRFLQNGGLLQKIKRKQKSPF
jgi:hypothetical protein